MEWWVFSSYTNRFSVNILSGILNKNQNWKWVLSSTCSPLMSSNFIFIHCEEEASHFSCHNIYQSTQMCYAHFSVSFTYICSLPFLCIYQLWKYMTFLIFNFQIPKWEYCFLGHSTFVASGDLVINFCLCNILLLVCNSFLYVIHIIYHC